MRKISALLATTAAIGFMSDTCEVVTVTGPNGPVRVNKADFDADQAKDTKDRQFKPHAAKEGEETEQSVAGVRTTFEALDGVEITAAPSAPNFNRGDGPALPIDPEKKAVAPATTSPNQRLVMKEGKTFFIVDSMGNKLKSEDVGGEIDPEGYKSKIAADAAIAKLPH